MKSMCAVVAFVAVVGSSLAAHAADKPCGQAEKAIDRVATWGQLYTSWQDFKHCDKGPIAELYTDAILRLIVDWKHMDGLASNVDKDKDYRQFIYDHLKSPAAKDDIQSVYSRAKASCPKGLDGFCTDLIAQIKPGAPAAPAASEVTLTPMTPLK